MELHVAGVRWNRIREWRQKEEALVVLATRNRHRYEGLDSNTSAGK